MVATWSDSDASDDDSYDDEVANLCFIALEDSKVTSILCDSNSYIFEELQDAFEELAIDFETMNFRYKKMNSKLNVESKGVVEFYVYTLGKKMCPLKRTWSQFQRRKRKNTSGHHLANMQDHFGWNQFILN